MNTKESANTIVRNWLVQKNEEMRRSGLQTIALIDDETIEEHWFGWVFHFVAKSYWSAPQNWCHLI